MCLFIVLMLFLYNVELSVGIIGGIEVRPGEFPFMVSLRNETDKHYCGGSVITRQHVLTAAHCLFTDRSGLYHQLYEMYEPSVIKAVVGTVYTDWIDGESYGASKLSPHPKYNVTNKLSMRNDIGLIKLEREIKTRNIVRISLSNKQVNYGDKATVIGWGIDSNENIDSNHKIARVLQKLDMTVLWTDVCVTVYLEYIPDLDYATEALFLNNALCCIHSRATTCYRDSGSPLIQNNKLVGIAIAGNQCKNSTPDIFTSVFHYYEFITDCIADRCAGETRNSQSFIRLQQRTGL